MHWDFKQAYFNLGHTKVRYRSNKQSSEGKCYSVKYAIQLGSFRKRIYGYNQHENMFNREALPGA